jgi:UDP-N-acetylmuramyl pentapeptide phosphotransferase/UDP-N-acetylglucosamine-1-phosphate transferase
LAIIVFITAFFISFYSIPSIIKVAEMKNLYDDPCSRKLHRPSTPTLGGVSIFAGVILTVFIYVDFYKYPYFQYYLLSLMVMFFTGIKDDILILAVKKKMLMQFLAAAILVFLGDVRLTSLYGIFGVYNLSYVTSSILSIFAAIGIINSYNLIDGIDTLSGSLGSIACLFFGLWFYNYGFVDHAYFCFALLGALLGFLYYNKTPARIFMGDTGALVVGIVCYIVAVKFIEFNKVNSYVLSAPSIAISVIIIPIFDTLRVMIIRTINGRSPFSPDREHLHHLLLDQGLSHMQGAAVLCVITVLAVTFSYNFSLIGDFLGLKQKYYSELITVCNFSFMITFSLYLSKLRNKKNESTVSNVILEDIK